MVIGHRLQQQIEFLHQKCGRTEWSGELITREEGTIHDLDKWKIVAEDIFLADVGSPGFTGYEVDKGGFKSVDIAAMYDAFPGLLEGTHKNHHIHTHHGMDAFFSGTDESQLQDRGCQQNYFLMLIVNFKKPWIARVAWKAEIKGSGTPALHFAVNPDNELKPIALVGERDREVLVVMECEVKYEAASLQVDESFKGRLDHVQKAVKEAEEEERRKRFQHTVYRNPSTYPGGSYYGGHNPYSRSNHVNGGTNSSVGKQNASWSKEQQDAFDRYDSPFKSGGKGKKNKVKKEKTRKERTRKISEMTDKEWHEYNKGNQGGVRLAGDFELRHATAMINAIIDKEGGLNFNPVPNRLYNLDFELKTHPKKADWVEGFILSLPDYLSLLFPEKDAEEDQAEMMTVMIQLLSPYQYTPLARMMVAALAEELATTELLLEEEDAELDWTETPAFDKGKGKGKDKCDDQECADALKEARLESHITHSYDKDADVDYSRWTPEGEANLSFEDDTPEHGVQSSLFQDLQDTDFPLDSDDLNIDGVKTVIY